MSSALLRPCRRLFYSYAFEPFQIIPDRRPEWRSPPEAVAPIKSSDKIYVHGIAATPTPLLNALCEHAKGHDLHDITLHHMHLEGEARWTDPDYEDHIRSNCLFISSNLRSSVNRGKADCVSIFLSEIPQLFRRRIIDFDVALIQCTPPDHKGFCSLGTSVDCTRSAIQNAKYIIGLANPQVPRTFGDGVVHMSHFDCMVYYDAPLHGHDPGPLSDEELGIGELIAQNLVEDGATLQMGIGAIPDAALAALKTHKDLGIHTEMFSDGVLDLVDCGAVSNSRKIIQPGKLVSSFTIGSNRLYKFIDDNPSIFMGDVSWVNDSHVIRQIGASRWLIGIIHQNPKVTAINSCIEIDLTGQISADSIGTRMYSGFGGQIDFIRGAALCNDGRGKPIIALTSVTKKGGTKIVPKLQEGAGVVTTRAHVHYVVTEYGIAYLFGKNMRQRAYALIQIAHPDHREILEQAAYERWKVMPSPD